MAGLNEEWYGQQIEADKAQLNDPGMGKPILLRQFVYAYAPHQKGKPKESDILTPAYMKHLNNILWIDELELIMEPKVVFKKKGFVVFATCQAKKGSLIHSEHLKNMKPIQATLQENETRRDSK